MLVAGAAAGGGGGGGGGAGLRSELREDLARVGAGLGLESGFGFGSESGSFEALEARLKSVKIMPSDSLPEMILPSTTTSSQAMTKTPVP